MSPSESDDLLGAAPPTVYVDLWPAAALSAVLDVDDSGRIAVVHEEATRPMGLLFGVPASSLEGEPLSAVLELPPGRSANDLLSLHGGSKKSNLKTKHKDVAVKVGPMHVLQGLVSCSRWGRRRAGFIAGRRSCPMVPAVPSTNPTTRGTHKQVIVRQLATRACNATPH